MIMPVGDDLDKWPLSHSFEKDENGVIDYGIFAEDK
jgi:hypothetical protein